MLDNTDATMQDRIDALNMCNRTVLITALCDATRPGMDSDTLLNLACMTQRELVNVCLVECVDVPGVPNGRA